MTHQTPLNNTLQPVFPSNVLQAWLPRLQIIINDTWTWPNSCSVEKRDMCVSLNFSTSGPT